MYVDGVTPRQVTDFLLNPCDEAYRAWWPGTHLAFHVVRSGPGDGHVGDVVWMDELIGSRRVRMAATVVEAVPGERVMWQARRWGVRLPVGITVALRPDDRGVALCHTITAGWRGPGRVLDPLWRSYFSARFAHDMDEHARTEFRRLGDLLQRSRRQPTSTRSPRRGTTAHQPSSSPIRRASAADDRSSPCTT
jgi:hypothetical protein